MAQSFADEGCPIMNCMAVLVVNLGMSKRRVSASLSTNKFQHSCREKNIASPLLIWRHLRSHQMPNSDRISEVRIGEESQNAAATIL